jgi:hypothetical protein
MGKNALGNTFGAAYNDFSSNVIAPYHKFLRDAYREYCAVRTLRIISERLLSAQLPM